MPGRLEKFAKGERVSAEAEAITLPSPRNLAVLPLSGEEVVLSKNASFYKVLTEDTTLTFADAKAGVRVSLRLFIDGEGVSNVSFPIGCKVVGVGNFSTANGAMNRVIIEVFDPDAPIYHLQFGVETDSLPDASVDELPAIGTNGQVLGVVAGQWQAIDAPVPAQVGVNTSNIAANAAAISAIDGLPSVGDEGQVLTTVEGVWVPAAASGGGSKTLFDKIGAHATGGYGASGEDSSFRGAWGRFHPELYTSGSTWIYYNLSPVADIGPFTAIGASSATENSKVALFAEEVVGRSCGFMVLAKFGRPDSGNVGMAMADDPELWARNGWETGRGVGLVCDVDMGDANWMLIPRGATSGRIDTGVPFVSGEAVLVAVARDEGGTTYWAILKSDGTLYEGSTELHPDTDIDDYGVSVFGYATTAGVNAVNLAGCKVAEIGMAKWSDI
jgi:hypothetical protein